MQRRSSASGMTSVEPSRRSRPLGRRMREAGKRVVTLLRRSVAPLSTYDILRRLNAEGLALRPPQAYRLVGRLTRERRIHRIESQGGYVACRMNCSQRINGEPQLLVCAVCGTVSELRVRQVDALLARIGARQGFQPRRHIVEIVGTCKACFRRTWR